jgi:DNA-binding NtrC family response regulator
MSRLPIIDEEHIQVLSGYSWPGNVRELRNVIERSLMLWGRGRFRIALPESKTDPKHMQQTLDYFPGKTLREAHEEVTRSLCSEALRHCKGNKTDAARLLGISRDAFYRYIKKFGIAS